jgi:hypothetical protein
MRFVERTEEIECCCSFMGALSIVEEDIEFNSGELSRQDYLDLAKLARLINVDNDDNRSILRILCMEKMFPKSKIFTRSNVEFLKTQVGKTFYGMIGSPENVYDKNIQSLSIVSYSERFNVLDCITGEGETFTINLNHESYPAVRGRWEWHPVFFFHQ